MDDENCKECYDCKSVFTTWRRKHHCRICGESISFGYWSVDSVNQVKYSVLDVLQISSRVRDLEPRAWSVYAIYA